MTSQTRIFNKKTFAVAVAMTLAGCATAPGQPQTNYDQKFSETFNNADPCSNNSRNTGAVGGALAGALLGKVLGNDSGTVIAAAAIGGFLGGVIGADMDHKRCELFKIAKQYNLQYAVSTVAMDGTVLTDAELQGHGNSTDIKKTSIGSVVSLGNMQAGGGHFATDSDVLTPRAQQYFAAIAAVYDTKKAAAAAATQEERQELARLGKSRKLLLVGHTDDTGSSKSNAELSERRAKAVASFLEKNNIPRDAIFYQGAGEVYPIADNNTERGREKNRRVDIVDMHDETQFNQYLVARKPNYRLYRPEAVLSVGNATSAPPATAPIAARSGKEVAVSKTAREARSDVKAAAMASPAPARIGTVAASTPLPLADTLSSAKAETPSAVVAAVKPVSSAPALKILSPTTRSAPVANNSTPSLANQPTIRSVGTVIDYGGEPLSQASQLIKVGRVETPRSYFSLISTAYADEPPVLSDCSRDRPRITGAVKALRNNAVYTTGDHVRGLTGKSWQDTVNGHLIVINKVAVLSNEASLAQIPELKVYANYNPSAERNPKPSFLLNPEVNTYLGETGILYRIFTNGTSGMQCIDILFNKTDGALAKAGKIISARDQKMFVTNFKPSIIK